jgi:CheY-like chemotaxis protein
MARILIIDDDPPLRTALGESLRRAGHEVVQAEEGRQGLELMRAVSADLVLTDLIMPGQEGLETIRQLHAEFPTLPIIAMSGGMVNAPLYLDMACRFGARAALTKPFTAEQLLAALAQCLPPKN